jgi:chromosome segregation and condensation protein ScpB
MELKFVIESILFTSQKPLNLRELREILTVSAHKGEEEMVKAHKKVKEEEIENALTELEKITHRLGEVTIWRAWRAPGNSSPGPSTCPGCALFSE